MMKCTCFAILMFFFFNALGQKAVPRPVTADIEHFWEAYDKIIPEKDSSLQIEYINRLFIEKGTPGLAAIMAARNYTAASYVAAIKSYPHFWNSIRANTFRAGEFAKQIEKGIKKLKVIYPALKPADIYFTVGALRTPGTTMNNSVLIGSELAMADSAAVTDEFPERLAYLKSYFAGNPLKEIVFLNIHEYVHTQQSTTTGTNLLSQCIIEGAAEFIAAKALGVASPTPAVSFGKAHDKEVKQKFEKEIYSVLFSNWLWNNADNAFKMRDLGYYIGYAICEQYYNKAADRKLAIKEMITLDYNNDVALRNFADRSGYFNVPVRSLKEKFNSERPVVAGIKEFANGTKNADPNLKTITLIFSKKMDSRFRNLITGPLGEEHLLPVVSSAGFAEDSMSITYGVQLKPNTHYQIIANFQFRSAEGLPLMPSLIDFSTGN